MTKVHTKTDTEQEGEDSFVHLLDTLVHLRKGQQIQGLQSEKTEVRKPAKKRPVEHTVFNPWDGQRDGINEGAGTGTLESLKKRERSKFYTGQVLYNLHRDEKGPMHDYFYRAHTCNHVIEQNGRRLKSRYCNTRFCHICNRIRTAKMMNGYGEQLKEFSEPRFVTLTAPTVKAPELRDEICSRLASFRRILDGWRKRYGKIPKGIRKLEVTYNSDSDWYHPHFHVIIDGNEKAVELVREWLERFPSATAKAQDIREVDQASMNELFKYATKPFTKSTKARTLEVYDYALENIAVAMKGKRSLQPFGGLKRVSEDVDETTLNGQIYPELPETPFTVWTYDEQSSVHVSKHGEILVDYTPPDIVFTHYDAPPEKAPPV